MAYEWKVFSATLAPPQPSLEPPQLEDVLNEMERKGWEVFVIVVVPAAPNGFNQARIVGRMGIG